MPDAMSGLVRYLTHPEVKIDPAVPVRQWRLNETGRARAETFARLPWLGATTRVVTSGEVKAIETGGIIAAQLILDIEQREVMHENDRTATGFLPANVFETVVDQFFTNPDTSVRGWETARHAQARIIEEVEAVLADHRGGDILFVGHGAVGTLLMCHNAGLAIDRCHDQPLGGGNYFSFGANDRRFRHSWRPMEA